MDEMWLKCRVFPGNFHDERFLEYHSPFGRDVGVFVPADFVEGDLNSEGRVRVRVFQKGAETWAVLPSEYSESVAISHQDLSPA